MFSCTCANTYTTIIHDFIFKLMSYRNAMLLIWVLTIVINGLILLTFFLPKVSLVDGCDYSSLPMLNAILNGLTFFSLLFASYAVRRKNILLHRSSIFLAFSYTTLFLFSYLLYHFSMPATHYTGDGILRGVYFFILFTHVVLAAIIVPLGLLSMAFALNNQISQHRKIARWTMPIWLYVSFTGVVVYLLISP